MARFRDLRAQRVVKGVKPFSEDRRRCIWCGRALSQSSHSRKGLKPTREHLLPRGLGGGGGKNLAAACQPCNSKRNRDLTWRPFKEGFDRMPEPQLRHLATVLRLPTHVYASIVDYPSKISGKRP